MLLLVTATRAISISLIAGGLTHLLAGQSHFFYENEVRKEDFDCLLRNGYITVREVSWHTDERAAVDKCRPFSNNAAQTTDKQVEDITELTLDDLADEVIICQKQTSEPVQKEYHQMARKRTTLQVAAAALLISAIASFGLRMHRRADFNTQYDQYIVAALTEDNPDKSVARAQHALAYLDTHGLNAGRTSVMYDSPETDVNDWYTNVSLAVEQYAKDKQKQAFKRAIYGTDVVDTDKTMPPSPPGISIHPNNQQFAIWGWGSGVLAALIFGCSLLTTNKAREIKAAEVQNVSTNSRPTFYLCGNMPHVIYRSQNGHIHDLWWNGTWNNTDVSELAGSGSLIAACDPTAIVVGNTQRIIFRGTDDCMHCFEYDYTTQGRWQYTNLTQVGRAPLALA